MIDENALQNGINCCYKFDDALKEYKKIVAYIGESDIAALTVVGCRPEEGAVADMIRFGGDGEYKAYLIGTETEVPGHYERVAEFSTWLKIYDDRHLVFEGDADRITIYRAGNYACLIQADFK